MCLVAIAIARSPRWPWVLASNRDEWFDRPAAPLAWWRPGEDGTELLGGRDLSAGGTWLALSRRGRLALVTNVREPGRFEAGLASRGEVVMQWLQALGDPLALLPQLRHVPRNGFNLLAADLRGEGGLWFSNRQALHREFGPGLVGLSNAALDTPWPKVHRLKQRLAQVLGQSPALPDLVAQAMAALADRSVAPDAELPATGVPWERERQLSAAFIRAPGLAPGSVYGTRCSTVVVVEQQGAARVAHVFERSFDAAGGVSGEVAAAFQLA